MQTKRNPSNEAVEATIRTICLFWAKQLPRGEFHPDNSARACHLSPAQADRYNTDLEYLWLNAADPYQAAMDATLSAHPSLHGAFDLQPLWD